MPSWVMGRDLCPLVPEAVTRRYLFSSSMDTGRSFPLCLDSCMESVPAEKRDFGFFFLGHLSLVPVLDPLTVWLWPAARGQEKYPWDCATAACAALAKEGSTSLPPLRAGSCPPSSPAQHKTQAIEVAPNGPFSLKRLRTEEHQPRGVGGVACPASHLICPWQQSCKDIASVSP